MILETERLTLRPFKESDAESIYEYAKDPKVGPAAGWPAHTSVENSLEVIKNVLMVPETYAICLKDTDKAIGAIGLTIAGQGQSNIKLKENEGEIGYWIGVPFWGQGLMPEATRELIRHAFQDLNVETLLCGYFEGNNQSKRVQEKCGFKYYETYKDIHWELMNLTLTEHITRLPKDDWKNSFTYRKLEESETEKALALAWEVFQKYESPDYDETGTEEFKKCLHDNQYLNGIVYYGAFDDNTLISMVGIRKDVCHICFFFTDGRYHRLGIGTKLFYNMKTDFIGKPITLNSSPYGLPFYKSLGFKAVDNEQTVNGIRFTPMILEG